MPLIIISLFWTDTNSHGEWRKLELGRAYPVNVPNPITGLVAVKEDEIHLQN